MTSSQSLSPRRKICTHEYISVRDEMRELLIHKSNVEKILGTDEREYN